MKKIITSALLVSAFAFVGCSGKKTACECMEMAPGMMMKVMAGSMSKEEAEKEMEACNWMDELTEEERLEAIKDCGGEFANKVKETFENASDELILDEVEPIDEDTKEILEEFDDALEQALDDGEID